MEAGTWRLKQHHGPQATSHGAYSEIVEAGLTSATSGNRTEPGTPLARYWPIRLWVSGGPLQARPGGADRAAKPILSVGARPSRGEPGLGQLQTQKYPPGVGEEDGPEKVEALETEKAQLIAQVAAMTQELTQKSKEIRKYQAEQTVKLSRVRELVGHPGEVVNKAHLFDQLMESANSSSSRQTLQNLVKYSRSVKDLLKEIQKLLPPRGTPSQMLDPGPPRSPTPTLYEVIDEVELVPTSRAGVGPSQSAGTPRLHESKIVPDREYSCSGMDPFV